MRQLGLEILKAVDRAVDTVVEQCLVDFLGKQSLTTDVRESGVWLWSPEVTNCCSASSLSASSAGNSSVISRMKSRAW